jgi:DNA invertase Pin-like site-specific DNA recombinase
MTTKRTAVYLRVSTSDQTTENQLHSIKKYCECQGWTIKQVYTDEGVSGAKDKRPQLDQLKEDIKKHKYDSLVVFKFDRLARSTSHLLECLQLFQSYGVDFVSVTEGIDTSTSIGKMIFTFLGGIAEFERSLIQERIKAALDLRKQQGVKLGRPRVGFDVNKALKLKQQGLSWRELAKKLNVSSATLRRSLTPLLKNLQVESCK